MGIRKEVHQLFMRRELRGKFSIHNLTDNQLALPKYSSSTFFELGKYVSSGMSISSKTFVSIAAITFPSGR